MDNSNIYCTHINLLTDKNIKLNNFIASWLNKSHAYINIDFFLFLAKYFSDHNNIIIKVSNTRYLQLKFRNLAGGGRGYQCATDTTAGHRSRFFRAHRSDAHKLRQSFRIELVAVTRWKMCREIFFYKSYNSKKIFFSFDSTRTGSTINHCFFKNFGSSICWTVL